MRPRDHDLLERVIQFGIDAVAFADRQPAAVGLDLKQQLRSSARSAAANYAEACEAESRKDFVHKMKVALKELRESYVWIRSANGHERGLADLGLVGECNELISIFVVSINTARNGGE